MHAVINSFEMLDIQKYYRQDSIGMSKMSLVSRIMRTGKCRFFENSIAATTLSADFALIEQSATVAEKKCGDCGHTWPENSAPQNQLSNGLSV